MATSRASTTWSHPSLSSSCPTTSVSGCVRWGGVEWGGGWSVEWGGGVVSMCCVRIQCRREISYRACSTFL